MNYSAPRHCIEDIPSYGISVRWRSLVQLAISELAIQAPQELRFKTGSLLLALSNREMGLTKEELVKALNPCFERRSPAQQASLLASLDKLIQRARIKVRPLGLAIEANRAFGTFQLVPCDWPWSSRHPCRNHAAGKNFLTPDQTYNGQWM